jgi:hypothetical protein
VKTPELWVLPLETPCTVAGFRNHWPRILDAASENLNHASQMDKEALNADPSMAPAPAKKAKKVKNVSTFDPSKDALKHISTPLRKKIWQVRSQAPHPEP